MNAEDVAAPVSGLLFFNNLITKVKFGDDSSFNFYFLCTEYLIEYTLVLTVPGWYSHGGFPCFGLTWL